MQATTFELPEIDAAYRTQHMLDKPFMMYPGEEWQYYDDDRRVIVTSFGRCFNNTTKKFYNHGQPIVGSTKSFNYSNMSDRREKSTQVKLYINPHKFIKKHWPESPVLVHQSKRPISKEHKQLLEQFIKDEVTPEMSHADVMRAFNSKYNSDVTAMTVGNYRKRLNKVTTAVTATTVPVPEQK